MFLVDLLQASLAMSLAFESSRARRDTLEFDDPYEGFATFPKRRKMKQRGQLVGKHANVDLDCTLRSDANFDAILSPFRDHFGSVFG